MELLDYIRKNYKTPNIAVLKTLGATDELIKYLVNTPNNTNIKVVESLINEGGSEAGNGIKSITISPAITTTPALDSMFPIYWEDLTEERRQFGLNFRLTTEMALSVGAEYNITITPTPEWYGAYLVGDDPSYGEKGEPFTFTKTIARSGQLALQVAAAETMDKDPKYVLINLTIDGQQSSPK